MTDDKHREKIDGYYIHDTTRGRVGNSLVWWRRNHMGYTCDINHAHVFSRRDALERVQKSSDLIAVPVLYVRKFVESHVTNIDALGLLGGIVPYSDEPEDKR